MFKVECPSCSAPYQVDERRVPAKGLTMRCPKCSTSFMVSSPMAGPALPVDAPVSTKEDIRGTMIGVPNVFARGPDIASGPATPGRPRDRKLSGTMIGISPHAAPAPTSRGKFSGTMIGLSADLPSVLQAKVGTAETKSNDAKSNEARSNSFADLPSVLAGGAPRFEAGETADMPELKVSLDASASAKAGIQNALPEANLPGLRSAAFEPTKLQLPKTDLPTPTALKAELPQPIALKPELPKAEPLKSVEPSKTADKFATSARFAASPTEPALPRFGGKSSSTSVLGGLSQPGGLLGRFPSVAQFDDEIATKGELDAPLPVLANKASAELPAAKPVISKPTAKSVADTKLKADIGRPAQSRLGLPDPDLPSVLAALDELDLDAVLPSTLNRSASIPLPEPLSAKPSPASKLLGSRAPKAMVPRPEPQPEIKEPFLLEVRSSIPPAVQALNEEEMDESFLESLPPSLPPAGQSSIPPLELDSVELGSLPPLRASDYEAPGFVGLELDVPPSLADAQPASRAKEFELPSPLRDFGAANASDGPNSFGSVQLPRKGSGFLDDAIAAQWDEVKAASPASSRSPASSKPSKSEDEFDEFGALPNFDDAFTGRAVPSSRGGGDAAPVSSASAPASQRASLDDYDDDMRFGAPPAALSVPQQASRPTPAADRPLNKVVSGGGTAWGEVDLGGGEDLPAEGEGEMEFGGIPQVPDAASDAERGESATGAAAGAAAAPGQRVELGAAVGPAPRIGPKLTTEADVTAPQKKRWKIGAAAVLGFVIAGGSLALLPNVGPFAAYWLSDFVQRGAHADLSDRALEEFQQLRAKDTYQAAIESVEHADSATQQAKRYKPLTALAAYARFSQVLRYAGPADAQSVAQVAVTELKAAGLGYDEPALLLSAAAEQMLGAADGPDLASALPGGFELERLALLGEKELRALHAAQAASAFEQAVAIQRSPRTLFGQARALILAGKFAEADKLAAEVLALNAGHFGAQLMRAELEWRWRHVDGAALAEVEQALKSADQVSPRERVEAHCLLGTIHLERGRISRAEAEFTKAMELEPKNLSGLLGLGETYYAGAKYTASLSRFEAALAGEPASIVAKIGVVKALLSSEQTERAGTVLSELLGAHPNDPESVYWLGRLREREGKFDAAKIAYRTAAGGSTEAPKPVAGAAAPAAANPAAANPAAANPAAADPVAAERAARIRIKAVVAEAQLSNKLGNVEDASKLLREAVKTAPGAIELHKSLGEVALSAGHYEEALTEFRQAQTLDPADSGAVFRVGSALRRLGQFDGAAQAFAKVAERDADFPGLALEQGLLLEQSGKLVEALGQYEAALVKYPTDPEVLLRVGCGRVVKGDGPAAEAPLLALLKLDGRSAGGNYCMGRALFLQSKQLEALKYLQRAVDLEPSRAEYHLYLGWAAGEAGQVAQAQDALDQAIKLDEGLAEAFWQRGALSLRQGANNDAVTDLKRALKLKPERAEIHADLAQAYVQLRREKEALAEWHIAIAGNEDNSIWLFRYGKLLSAVHRNEEATERLNKAVELGEKEASAPGWLWQAHYLLAVGAGKDAVAVKHFRRFLELGPPDSPYRVEAKRALQKAGEPWAGK